MGWRQIDSRYLRQIDPEGLTVAYVSHGGRDTGHLLLYLDNQRDVARFELAYERFLSRRELFAEWDRGTGFRIGEVETDDDAGDWGWRLKMSPIVRYRRPSAAMLGRLLGYVERNAGVLDSRHRQAVVSVLRDALHGTAADPSDGADDPESG